jgi:Inner membrane protein YgaP-like, transmembrane domain
VSSKILPKNEGAVDRTLRVVVGVVLLSLVFVGPQTPWGWLGLVPLITGLAGSCPVYTLLGLRTCPMKQPT